MTIDICERICLHHRIDGRADRLRFEHGPAERHDVDRIAHLVDDLGDVAGDVKFNGGLDLDHALVRLAAEVQIWLEDRAREAAR